MWNEEFHEQIDLVFMGSPPSPVITNLFMERFEEHVLELAHLKLKPLKTTWSHDEELKLFLQHINSKNRKKNQIHNVKGRR
jgi:hypothetical protein